jgi:hypothetical protein
LGLAFTKSLGLLRGFFFFFQPLTESLLQVVVGLFGQVKGGEPLAELLDANRKWTADGH